MSFELVTLVQLKTQLFTTQNFFSLSISKNNIKRLKSLQRKKIREQEGVFIAEGVKIVDEILQQASAQIREIYALPEWINTHRQQLLKGNFSVDEISLTELKSISSLQTPNQVLVVAQNIDNQVDEELVGRHLSLYLDEIQDPGNLGTILRIADWFGIPYVFCSKGCVDVYNYKVIQSSMGAFLRVKTPQITLSELKSKHIDLPIYGAVMQGENLYKMPLSPKGILVIGNEGRGISKELQELLTHKITIPRGVNGGAESLNAGVATGILCSVFLGK